MKKINELEKQAMKLNHKFELAEKEYERKNQNAQHQISILKQENRQNLITNIVEIVYTHGPIITYGIKLIWYILYINTILVPYYGTSYTAILRAIFSGLTDRLLNARLSSDKHHRYSSLVAALWHISF